MIVTNIEPVTKVKSKVFIDEQLAFALYKGELSRYHLKVGNEVSQEIYQEITEEVLVKRAKLRAMNILKSMDKTEHELRTKLCQNFYPQEVVDIAIDYVQSYHYIDDRRYVKSYIDWKKKSKSRRQIENELLKKGIAKELIAEYYEDEEVDEEIFLVKKLAQKKCKDLENITKEERQKLYQFLMRKGFRCSDINRVLKGNEEFYD
jgi:regulatory protein